MDWLKNVQLGKNWEVISKYLENGLRSAILPYSLAVFCTLSFAAWMGYFSLIDLSP